jgi:hypothetical protein
MFVVLKVYLSIYLSIHDRFERVSIQTTQINNHDQNVYKVNSLKTDIVQDSP